MKKKNININNAFPRKFPIEYDNFIDIILYHIADFFSPFFKKLNFTPNMFTTLSFLVGLFSNYCFYIKKYKLSAFMYLLSYWFDTIDGHYARLYNMQSKLGDYYDHITDAIVSFIFLILFTINTKMPLYYKKLAGILCAIILGFTAYHFNCVEDRNKNDKRYIRSETIRAVKVKNCTDKLKFTSLFNTGTVTIYLMAYIIFHDYV